VDFNKYVIWNIRSEKFNNFGAAIREGDIDRISIDRIWVIGDSKSCV